MEPGGSLSMVYRASTHHKSSKDVVKPGSAKIHSIQLTGLVAGEVARQDYYRWRTRRDHYQWSITAHPTQWPSSESSDVEQVDGRDYHCFTTWQDHYRRSIWPVATWLSMDAEVDWRDWPVGCGTIDKRESKKFIKLNYHPLICDPSDDVQLPRPVKHTWTSKFPCTILVRLLVAETIASVIIIIILAARVPHTTCTVPLEPQHVLYSGLNVFLAEYADHPSEPPALEAVKQELDPDYYQDWRISTTNNLIPSQKDATEHLAHCVSLGLLFLTVLPQLAMGERQNHGRKFSHLQEWGKDHQLKMKFDPTVHIEDNIFVPIFHNEIP
ncbi:hypothetical protein B0H13DRAFT_1900465 [Mycena leptocephala]|nr:hypothetical protein B0H13DRAFT_1900465 [Mycena leptocephala]